MLTFIVQLSHPYVTTGKIIALTRQTFVGKVITLLLNILSRLVIIFLPRSKYLLISWLYSPSAAVKWLCLYIQQINFLLYVHETRIFHKWKLAKCPRQLNLMLYIWVWAMCWEDPFEEEMATHSSILVWRIPMDRGAWWATSTGSQRVGHDWSELACMLCTY